MVLIAAGGYALTSLLYKPLEAGVNPVWLIAVGLIAATFTVLIIGFASEPFRLLSLHQGLGALLVLTGVLLMTL
jgi:hypothetical protein